MVSVIDFLIIGVEKFLNGSLFFRADLFRLLNVVEDHVSDLKDKGKCDFPGVFVAKNGAAVQILNLIYIAQVFSIRYFSCLKHLDNFWIRKRASNIFYRFMNVVVFTLTYPSCRFLLGKVILIAQVKVSVFFQLGVGFFTFLVLVFEILYSV